MMKALFSKEVRSINLDLLTPALKGYDCFFSEGSVKIRKKYTLKGQEMNRIFIKEEKSGLSIFDGWNSLILKTSKENLLEDIQRVFSGEFSGPRGFKLNLH